MRKYPLLIILITVACLSVGSFFIFKEDKKVIKVTSFLNDIPEIPPFQGAKFAENMKESGYHFEWVIMPDQPKKRHYLKRFKYFLRNLKTEKIVFNNLHTPYFIDRLKRIPKEKLILIAWEPPSVFEYQYKEEVLDLFGVVLTWNDELVDGKKFIKFHYPNLKPFDKNIPSFEERKLLCMINSNLKFNDFEKELYSLRRKAVRFFESKPDGIFDLYGKGWEMCKNDKGRVPDKQKTLKEYKFNLCFENAAVPGYITEKIFDSFAVGAIPIYLGAPNIEEYIPKECFIDYREFKDFDEMLTFIQEMTKEEYESYLSDIQAYLVSPKSRRFTSDHYLETLSRTLNSKPSDS